MLMNLMLSVVFFACFASVVAGGLWNNALLLVNVIFSALLAMNYYEPLAGWLEEQLSDYTYYWDFIALWAVFSISMIILRTATDSISKVRVRFRRPVEIVGGILLASWIAWTMVSFTTATLHTAPMAQNFMRGGFQETPQSKMFFGRAPDQRWLGFTRQLSQGAYSKSKLQVFDPQGQFILKYGWRRAAYEKEK